MCVHMTQGPYLPFAITTVPVCLVPQVAYPPFLPCPLRFLTFLAFPDPAANLLAEAPQLSFALV